MLTLSAVVYVGLLVAGSLVCSELGHRLGRLRLRDATPGDALETFVLGLLGLLFAFTFASAIERFVARRTLVLEEANDIGTAHLRLDLLPQSLREPARLALRDYVDARLVLFRAVDEREPPRPAEEVVNARAATLWRVAVEGARADPTPVTMILLPALNDLFDRGAERALRLRYHPPPIVYMLLFIVTLVAAFVTSYRPPGRSHEHDLLMRVVFAGVAGLIVLVINDLEHPSHGFFRADEVDPILVAARASLD